VSPQVSAAVTARARLTWEAKHVPETTGKVPELLDHHGRAALRPSKGGAGWVLIISPPNIKNISYFKGGDIGEGLLYANTFF
jgi:hypothetical protein